MFLIFFPGAAKAGSLHIVLVFLVLTQSENWYISIRSTSITYAVPTFQMRQFIVITDVRLMVFLLQLDIYAWCCSKHSCSVMLVLYSSSSLSGCWDTTSKFKEHVGSWVLNCSLQGFCGSRCLFAHDFGFFLKNSGKSMQNQCIKLFDGSIMIALLELKGRDQRVAPCDDVVLGSRHRSTS